MRRRPRTIGEPLRRPDLILCLLLALPLAAQAKIHRDPHARQEFKQLHPCPANGRARGACPGYVIDHVKPLACGGADRPDNMQWQTRGDAAAKDRWERIGC
jgi:hypothetical protein